MNPPRYSKYSLVHYHYEADKARYNETNDNLESFQTYSKSSVGICSGWCKGTPTEHKQNATYNHVVNYDETILVFFIYDLSL